MQKNKWSLDLKQYCIEYGFLCNLGKTKYNCCRHSADVALDFSQFQVLNLHLMLVSKILFWNNFLTQVSPQWQDLYLLSHMFMADCAHTCVPSITQAVLCLNSDLSHWCSVTELYITSEGVVFFSARVKVSMQKNYVKTCSISRKNAL